MKYDTKYISNDKFEYKMVVQQPGTIAEITEQLNQLGRDGWELTYHDYGCFIFKRKIT